jgi:hypothetical protein
MKTLYEVLIESTGMFKQAEKVVDILVDEIKKHIDEIDVSDGDYYLDLDESPFNSIPQLFFKQITIIVSDKVNYKGMYYVGSKDDDDYIISKWNDEDKTFNWIDIVLNYDYIEPGFFDEYEIAETLQHELQHAYQDWQKYKNNGVNAYLQKFKKNLDKQSDSDEFYSYYLDKDEVEGFLNNIQRYVRNLKGRYDVKDIYKKLGYYDDYKIYKSIYMSALNDNPKMTNKQKKLAKYYWNKLNNHIYSFITQN